MAYNLTVLVGFVVFFFNDTATTEIYTLSLHDALPIWMVAILEEVVGRHGLCAAAAEHRVGVVPLSEPSVIVAVSAAHRERSEEHTSELQSRQYLVCRLLLEKKKPAKSYLHIASRLDQS